MARRGRPRKQRIEYDLGTPELRIKRMFISPQDPTLASNPLDALKAREIISAEAHGAAVHFLACHRKVFGSPHPQAIDPNHISTGQSMSDNAGAESSYREACAMLMQHGRRVFDAIENIVIHERWPDWFHRDVPHRRAKHHALTGFACLLGWHTGHRRAAE